MTTTDTAPADMGVPSWDGHAAGLCKAPAPTAYATDAVFLRLATTATCSRPLGHLLWGDPEGRRCRAVVQHPSFGPTALTWGKQS